MNYLLTGAEFNNKGAEAMALVALKNIYDYDKNAVIYTIFFGKYPEFSLKNNIHFFEVSTYQIESMLGNFSKYFIKERLKDFVKAFIPGKKSYFWKYKTAKSILKSIDVMIDISGFSFSSKWGDGDTVEFSNKILLLNKHGARVYLMPQSFGPYDYKDENVLQYGLNALKKCNKIYAREKIGYESLIKFGLTNVEYCPDSVLIERNFNPFVLLKTNEPIKEIQFNSEHNVAIIPNYRLIDKGGYNVDRLLNLYRAIVVRLLRDYKVYLIAHAGEDLDICKMIKALFADVNNVILIDYVMISFNYEIACKNFDFIIGSRYHAIVHAYKQCTPALVLGWADKYQDITSLVKQDCYLLDYTDTNRVIQSLMKMEKSYRKEKEVIKENLNLIQQYNCYKVLQEMRK